MSWRLLTLGGDAEVPTQSHRLVLIKLVDCCDDDGRNIYPAVSTVAKFAKCSTRQVQRVLKEFCRVGLLRRIRDGGRGPASTAHYEMDIDLLTRLRRAELYPALLAAASVDPLADDGEDGESHAQDACGGSGRDPDYSDSKGDTVSPLAAARVTPATSKGDELCHPTPQRTLKPEKEGAQAPAAEPANGDGGSTDGHADDADQRERPPASIVAFRKAWPTSVADDKIRVENAWIALSAADRQLALDGVAPFLAHLKRLKRNHIPAGDRYLAQRKWADLSQAVAGAPASEASGPVAPWSRDWWLLLLDRIFSGRSPGFWVQQADAGKMLSATAAELAAAGKRVGELRAFICTGAEIDAWRPWLASKGARIPAFAASATFRVFLPSETPPGGHRDDDDNVPL